MQSRPRPQHRRKALPPGIRRQSSVRSERRGVSVVDGIITDELNWLFREQPVLDFGVDAHLEVVHDDDLVTGRNIGLQIKSGASYTRRPGRHRDGWNFTATNDHLAYWLGHSLPIVVLVVNPDKTVFWQVVTPDTVTENPKTFKMFIPKSQPFDASAKQRLLEIAGTGGGIREALPRRYEQLPPGAVHALRRAEATDALAVARLADRLARGNDLTQMTSASLIAAAPTWLARSAAAEDLWLAVATYAAEHGHHREAAAAFLYSADLEGPRTARSRAFAGLMLLYAGDRDRSPDLLQQAREGGAVLLADIGLTALESPPDDARAVTIPPSIRNATPAEVDAEPTVLNFLSEAALRSHDLNKAVEYQRRALACNGDDASGTRLSLAQAIFRREFASTQPSAREQRQALIHAQAAVEGRRRWRGPSAEALAFLLEVYLVTGEMTEAVTAALPVSHGGTARDYEATDPAVARPAALAAYLAGDATAKAWFLSVLPDDPSSRLVHVQLDDVAGASRQDLVATLTRLIEQANDDETTAKCLSRLAHLGVWPPQADDLGRRSIIPAADLAVLRAIHRARSGDQDHGLAELRQLADRNPMAAVALVQILDEDVSGNAAIAESERRVAGSPDSRLRLQLVDLLRKHHRDDRAAQVAEETIRDTSHAVFLRLELCRWYITEKQRTGDISAVVRIARQGLQITDDPRLAWVLVSGLRELGDLAEARAALARYQPEPVSDQEIHLWIHLRLGQRLSADDAQTVLDLIDRQPDGPVRRGLIVLLVRDVLVAAQPGDTHYPPPVVARTKALADAAHTDDELGLQRIRQDDDEAIREILTRHQPDPATLERLIGGMRQGTNSAADLAQAARQPYGTALLYRPAGVVFASDLTPGLRRAGQTAAQTALAAGRAVIDMSSLDLLNLLDPGDRVALRDAIRELCVPVTTVNDAIRTRDAVHSSTIATQFMSLTADGQIERTSMSAAQRGWLRSQAERLEDALPGLQPHPVSQPVTPLADAIDLAVALGTALWCDDAYGRQQARGRAVPTFSLLDLITVLAERGALVDPARINRLLAGQHVVDLPLNGDDIIALAADTNWRAGPAHTLLSRPGWWQHHAETWSDTWYSVARTARRHSENALAEITKAALIGSLLQVSPGRWARRHLDLAVIALLACHDVGQTAPRDLLTELAATAGQDSAPSAAAVRYALITELGRRSVADPAAAVQRLLPRLPRE